ncbi:MAG: ATP-binding cassette domain-containing protein [Deltaproteobacteria bacterium]|nr:ATP-binding cassette domain-containing protein [Deltaproteobacteria bacterium]MBW2611470.1 ATP-binding cassette domain-containing protein [Deltaproteobacteria bacterium]MBW2678007.1 ATP-binding cassette domain-containing protein [Deltaproteobacteria bacterium]
MKIHRFNAFESQISYFTSRTGVHLPRMTFGKGVFFKDLGRWSNTYDGQARQTESVHILPDPVQGLSFPRPLDVLSSALSLSSRMVDTEEIYGLLEYFGLPVEKATQPVISLSGGEILLLNFAKAKAMLPFVEGLVACSPIHWLNENRYSQWEKLVEAFDKKKRFVDVALLEGEPFIDEKSVRQETVLQPVPAVTWQLGLDDPVVVFEEIRFPSYHPASRIEYKLDDGSRSINLESPVLITGDNGVGKSIFAKVLSGIIKPSGGSVAINAPNGSGHARLIFQDAIDQLFGKSIDGHMDWVFRFDEDKRRIAKDIYAELDAGIRNDFQDRTEELEAMGSQSRKCTLLQAKISLIAERLATRTPVLVLDEPGWGLSRSIARKLVETVSRTAGKMHVAIVLISHHARWWQGMVHSRCHLSQEGKHTVVIGKV